MRLIFGMNLKVMNAGTGSSVLYDLCIGRQPVVDRRSLRLQSEHLGEVHDTSRCTSDQPLFSAGVLPARSRASSNGEGVD